MKTLADYGVVTLTMSEPLEQLNPKCILIKESRDWEEIKDILEQNKITHPEDKIWIGYDFKKGVHQIGRQA